jgi:DNA-binding transcriptional MerR regulator
LATAEKAPGALKTIGELSAELGVAQHILRYWETRFPQLKPMQRAGNRRYYRPADVDLARRINRLLNEEGYTVRGVQKLLRDRGGQGEAPMMETSAAAPLAAAALQPEESREPPAEENGGVDVFRLIALRDRLQDALKD